MQALNPQEQEAVRQFVEYLKRRDASSYEPDFLRAAEEFNAEHQDLLQRLAQWPDIRRSKRRSQFTRG